MNGPVYMKAFVVLILICFNVNSSAWTKSGVPNTTLTAKYLDAFVSGFLVITHGRIWNDSLHQYHDPDNTATLLGVNARDEFMNATLIWSSLAILISLDGSDTQVARTGLSRDELFRRARTFGKTFSGNPFLVNSDIVANKTAWDSALSKGRNIFNSKSYSAPNFVLREQSKNSSADSCIYNDVTYRYSQIDSFVSNRYAAFSHISLGTSSGMDYGYAYNFITWASAPQMFADPRLIDGRSIKEWSQKYCSKISEDNSSWYFYRQTPYTPEFVGYHHGKINPTYANCPFNRHGPTVQKTLSKLLKGQAISADEVWPYYLEQQRLWNANLVTGNGIPYLPNGSAEGSNGVSVDPGNPFTIYGSNCMSMLANAWGNKDFKAFELRQCESCIPVADMLLSCNQDSMLATKNMAWTLSSLFCALPTDYIFHRMLGSDDDVPAYAEASKRLQGTFFYRTVRYALHRTPDKFVGISWNGMAEGGLNATLNMTPYVNYSRADKIRVTLSPTLNLVTQVFPDNDSLRPDNEWTLQLPQGGITGELVTSNGTSAYAQSEVQCRMEGSDGVMSTAAKINWVNKNANGTWDPPVIPAVQYQSFTSFYDKTTICMTEIVRGNGNYTPIQWKDGVVSSIVTQKAFSGGGITAHADCDYEGGRMNFMDATGVLGDWWCVNGRLGMAAVGGKGSFKATRISTWCGDGNENGQPITRLGPYTGYQPLWNGVYVGWNETLPQSAQTGTKLASLAVAYFTDTPADRVQYLKSTLVALDTLLPTGWKGLVSETPDSQRVLALARLYGGAAASLSLTFPEGAPVFERTTTITGTTSSASFIFDTLESFGQTMAFYVTGNVTEAIQVGDCMIKLKGTGDAVVKYLSRSNANSVYLNNVVSLKTKAELRQGITLALTDVWTTVRIENKIDEDHTGPAVQMKWPEYMTMEQTAHQSHGGAPRLQKSNETAPVVVSKDGLMVKVDARDRSGVVWIDIYLDWKKVGRIEEGSSELRLSPETLMPDSLSSTLADPNVHAIFAVACDGVGNIDTSFSVPFRVKFDLASTGIEYASTSRTSFKTRSIATVAGSNSRTAQETDVKVNTTKKLFANINAADTWVARGRVKPDASGIAFSCSGVDYVLGLSAKTNRVSLVRKSLEKSSLVGEVVMIVSPGKWYDLKVKVADGKLVNYVNGEEKFVVRQDYQPGK